MDSNIQNSFRCKAFNGLSMAIATGTKVLISPLYEIVLKVPRVGAYLALGGILGAAAIPGKVFGAAGDTIDDETYSLSTSQKPVGVSWDSINKRTNWATTSEVRTGYYNPGSSKVIDWPFSGPAKYLAQGEVNGVESFVTLNTENDNIYIVNATDGSDWTSWTYPDSYPGYIQGIAVSKDEGEIDEILIYNGALPKRIGKFSPAGTHLGDIFVPNPQIQTCDGISLNQNGDFLMNRSNDLGFYEVDWDGQTGIADWVFFTYAAGPAGNKEFTDITFNAQSNWIYLSTMDPNNGDSQQENVKEGPPQPPTPTLTPTVTPSPSVTPTPSVTTTPTLTPSPSPTPSTTPIGYKTPVPTATPTPTPSVTPSPSVTHTVTPSPTVTPTPQTLEDKIAIFRPSSGLWAIKDGTRVYFGGTGDRPLYRDYNGDGTSDIAIFRVDSGLWAVRGITRVYFGGPGDEPVPADYAGNSAADIGIFRPSSGLWAIKELTRVYFGSSIDEAVPADYDGDGSADIGIFRETSGLWAVRGITRAYFGGSSDIPVPGYYAGDGTFNIGIFRGSSGLWAIKGVTRSYFGGSTDEPVPGDYDGSGTQDIGIFRETSGLWAIRELTRCYFGDVGDIPVTR